MTSEQQILKEIRKVIPNSNKYLSDDCAIIEKNLVITSDTIVENVHFFYRNASCEILPANKYKTQLADPAFSVARPKGQRRSQFDYSPFEIGWKALAVNLSDIASMGAKPLYAMVSLSLPKNIDLKFIKELYKGIQTCAKKYKTQIIGGNLTSSKEISITITLIGKAESPALRKNAQPGDLVFCTGTFGDAAAGYLILTELRNASSDLLKGKEYNSQLSARSSIFLKSLKTPIPQIDLGQQIVSSCSRVSMMDASDGLADCLIQISNQSSVRIIVDENKIPISKELISACKTLKKDPLMLSLYGGEDYQLVGTINKNDYKKIKTLKNVKIIGEVVKGKSAFVKQKNSKLVKLSLNKSFKHFA